MSKVIDGIIKDLKSIPKTVQEKTKSVDKKKLVLMSIPYVLVGYFCDKLAWLCGEYHRGRTLLQR